LDAGAVPADPKFVRPSEGNFALQRGELVTITVEDLAHDFDEIEIFRDERHSSDADPRNVEKILDELRQSIHLPIGGFQHLQNLVHWNAVRILPKRLHETLRVQLQRSQWCLQLMRSD